MNLKITREFDINQILEFEATDKQKSELIKDILFNQMDVQIADILVANILKDFMDAEAEFENRTELINAYKVIINSLLKKGK